MNYDYSNILYLWPRFYDLTNVGIKKRAFEEVMYLNGWNEVCVMSEQKREAILKLFYLKIFFFLIS